jgi:two-component system sensor histidine kinase UhpB
MQDVTEQRILQETLIDAQTRHKDEVAQSVLQAEEAERKKLGEELHDNINQLLGVVKLYIQHALVNPKMREELLHKSASYITQTIEEIRQLSRSLLPPALQEHGLLESLHQLIDDIRPVKAIDFKVEHEGFDESKVPDNKCLILYRIIQEQLNNALKHSNAQSVIIRLAHCGERVQLMIQDDGIGFDPGEVKPGMGLNNIHNRIEVFNGEMEIVSSPGNGCVLKVKI